LRGLLAAALFVWAGAPEARAAEPITIGLGMALTGGIAVVGKSGLLAMQIWAEDVNAKGGLLGRPVKLIYYDDREQPCSGAQDLHQAPRRRQSRPRDLRLRDQPGGAGIAGDDPTTNCSLACSHSTPTANSITRNISRCWSSVRSR
jgi:hypothetical protein